MPKDNYAITAESLLALDSRQLLKIRELIDALIRQREAESNAKSANLSVNTLLAWHRDQGVKQ